MNSSGKLIEKTRYDPFGSELTGGNKSKYGYNGKEEDVTTGLLYYGTRYYNPRLKRWTQADPTIQDIYDPQTLNRYSYVLNNPIKLTDPKGLSALLIGTGVNGGSGSGWCGGQGSVYINGEKKGYYSYYGGGILAGHGAAAGLEITYIPKANDIKDVEGESMTFGTKYFSYGGASLSVNYPLDSNKKIHFDDPSYTLSGGVGAEFAVSALYTITEVSLIQSYKLPRFSPSTESTQVSSENYLTVGKSNIQTTIKSPPSSDSSSRFSSSSSDFSRGTSDPGILCTGGFCFSARRDYNNPFSINNWRSTSDSSSGSTCDLNHNINQNLNFLPTYR